MADPNRPVRALIPREENAIAFLMQGDTAKDALIKAGYTESTASKHSKKVFDRLPVARELARRRALRITKAELSEAWIIERLMMLADSQSVLAKFKKVGDKGGLTWDFTGATVDELATINALTVVTSISASGTVTTTTKINAADPKGALDSLARTKGMFQDKVKFEGELSLVDRLIRGRERARIEYEETNGD